MFLFFIAGMVHVLIDAILLCMLIRVVMQWFDPEGESRFSVVMYMITEPIIMPVRKICERFNWFQDTPFDIPFIITDLILIALTWIV